MADDTEIGLNSEEIIEQATGYWLFATNGESNLLRIEADCNKIDAMTIALEMTEQAHRIFEMVRE